MGFGLSWLVWALLGLRYLRSSIVNCHSRVTVIVTLHETDKQVPCLVLWPRPGKGPVRESLLYPLGVLLAALCATCQMLRDTMPVGLLSSESTGNI